MALLLALLLAGPQQPMTLAPKHREPDHGRADRRGGPQEFGAGLAGQSPRAGRAVSERKPGEVIAVWWQYIIIMALIALGIYGFVALVRCMTQQMSRKTDRRAEDMYDEFGSARKEKDRWPI
jgi:hypothetical protein